MANHPSSGNGLSIERGEYKPSPHMHQDKALSHLDEEHTILDTHHRPVEPHLHAILRALPPLATFSILGVVVRFLLGKCFGPEGANITSDNFLLYKDLPANMVGCFFMGWVGVVFKQNLEGMSELFALGLSIGFMGSITTFSGWNQSMVAIAMDDHYTKCFLGLILGMQLSQMSFIVGEESAKVMKQLYSMSFHGKPQDKIGMGYYLWTYGYNEAQPPFQLDCNFFVTTSFALWVGSSILAFMDMESSQRRKLWIGCMLGPLGTWVRFLLMHVNWKGVTWKGKPCFIWFPVNTFLINVGATIVESTLVLIQTSVNDAGTQEISESLRLGFLGCMSTMSAFVVEIDFLYKSSPMKRWRAYVYILFTLTFSISVGCTILSFPSLINVFNPKKA